MISFRRQKTLFWFGLHSLFSLVFATKGFSNATYDLPFSNELKEFTSFNVTSEVSKKDDKYQIKFNLPEDLVGERNVPIELYEKNRNGNKITFSSGSPYQIIAPLCTEEKEKLSCFMFFDFYDVDIENVQEFLAAKYAGDETLESRMAVAENFGHEAIGFFNYYY